jgi:tetratricopeptide (TPR) repeat protein
VSEIKQELDNIRAAWSWAVTHGPAEIFQGACEALGLFFQYTGGYLEGLRLFTQATEILQTQEQIEATQQSLLRTLIYTSLFNLRFGRLEAVEQSVEQFQAIYEQQNLPFLRGLLSDPATHLSFVALIRGDYETAVHLAEQARQTAADQRHLVNHQYAFHLLSESHIGLGNYEMARQFAQKAYALAQKTGDSWMLSYLLNSMGQLAVALDDQATAKAHFQTSYELRQAHGDPAGMALTLSNLGNLALKEGEYAEAERHFAQSRTLYQEINDNGGLAAANRGLGIVACAQDNFELAQEYFRQAVQLSVAINYRPLIMALAVNIAELLWALGQRERPLRLLAFTAQHPASDHETRHTAVQQLAAWETAVSAQLFANASQQAQNDDLQSLIEMLQFELA